MLWNWSWDHHRQIHSVGRTGYEFWSPHIQILCLKLLSFAASTPLLVWQVKRSCNLFVPLFPVCLLLIPNCKFYTCKKCISVVSVWQSYSTFQWLDFADTAVDYVSVTTFITNVEDFFWSSILCKCLNCILNNCIIYHYCH